MHTCPECGQACTCNGDIEDCLDICEADSDNCIHDCGPLDDDGEYIDDWMPNSAPNANITGG